MLVGAYLCYGLQSQSPTDGHLYACVGMDCNPRVQGTHPQNAKKKPPKRINFWSNTLCKNGFRKKESQKKNYFCPFWMLVQDFCLLLIQNTQRKN